MRELLRKKRFSRIVEEIADAEQADAVTNDILSQLTDERALVLRLRYCDGLSYDDIALEMNIDSPSVEKLLDQAKYHLRKLDL